jgi:hypothetical protein
MKKAPQDQALLSKKRPRSHTLWQTTLIEERCLPTIHPVSKPTETGMASSNLKHAENQQDGVSEKTPAHVGKTHFPLNQETLKTRLPTPRQNHTDQKNDQPFHELTIRPKSKEIITPPPSNLRPYYLAQEFIWDFYTESFDQRIQPGETRS